LGDSLKELSKSSEGGTDHCRELQCAESLQ
jgi:hypothetical protein